MFRRLGVVDVLLDVTFGNGRGGQAQRVGLEGALEVLTTLHSVGVISVGLGQTVLQDHVFGTAASEFLVFLLGHLQHGGTLVISRRGRTIITETTLEELGTTGLVETLVFCHHH